MFHLLTNTSIFLNVGNGSLCQVSGKPIYLLRSGYSNSLNREASTSRHTEPDMNGKDTRGKKRSAPIEDDNTNRERKRQCLERNTIAV